MEGAETVEAAALETTDMLVEKTGVIKAFFESLGLSSISTLLAAIVVFLICLVFIKVVTKLLDRLFASGNRLDATVKGFLSTAVRIVLWAIAIVVIAGVLGIPTASLVAVISIAGLALSLSMQNILSNLFSGITLLLNRPMSVGEYVEIGATGGTVEKISLFYTVLTSLNKQTITIPNGDVAASTIVNYAREPKRRVQFLFGADYNDATEDVFAALLDAAAAVPQVLQDPAPDVFINSYQDSSIEYGMNLWCKPGDYWEVLHKVNTLAREEYKKHGVHMSFNHINVHMMKD